MTSGLTQVTGIVKLSGITQTVGISSLGGLATSASSLVPRLAVAGKITITCGGQSLKDYWFKRGSGDLVSNYFCLAVQTAMGFANVRAFTTWDSGDSCSDAASSGSAAYTVKAWNRASGGSSLWDSATGAGLVPNANYWWNVFGGNSAATGNALDDIPNSAGPLARAMGVTLALGTTDLIDWDQGTTNAVTVTTDPIQALYAATLQSLFAYFRTQTAKTTPINMTLLGNDNVASMAGTQRIKEAQLQTYAAMPYIYLLGQGYDAKYAQATNLTSASYTSGTNIIAVADTSSLGVNDIVVGTGIPDNTWVTAISDGTHFTISVNATSTIVLGVVYRLDGVHKYPGGNTTVQPYDSNGNTTYDHSLGFFRISARIAANIPRIYTSTSGIKCGPQISAISAVGGHNYIDVTVTQDQGTTLQAGVDITQTGYEWLVAVTHSGVTTNYVPSAVALTDSTHLRLTFGTTLTGGDTVALTNIYGAFNKTSTLNYITDNATVPMPIVPSTPNTDPAMTVTASVGIPANTVIPSISGGGNVGSTLTAATGTWTDSPTSYAYKWQSDATGSYVGIGGATASTYVSQSGDGGHNVKLGVAATNAVGTSSYVFSNAFAVTARSTSPLSAAVASAVFDLDATLSSSTDLSSQTWTNIITAPADGAAQTDYDLYRGAGSGSSTDDPTGTGSANDTAAYWALDGGDYWTLKTAANTTFLKNLHKTTGGAPFTFAIAFRTGPVLTAQQVMLGTASASTDTGLHLDISTTQKVVAVQDNTAAASSTTSTATLTASTDYLVLIGIDYTADTGAIWINTRTGQTVNPSSGASVLDPSFAMRIGARGTNSSRFESGTRVYGVYMFNEVLDNTKAGLIYDALNSRHNRTYA